MVMRSRQLAFLMVLVGVLLSTTGCRYMSNRYFDFRDMWALGAGVTSENSCTGNWPPSLGVYVEATDYLHLGAITHNGYTAEWDLRGSGIYRENRTRMGFLCWQALHEDQDYVDACYKNYFKTPGNMWEEAMKSPVRSWGDAPAKDLTYDHWTRDMQYGYFLRHRGWQYWEYVGAEFAICEPFVTHLGVMVRAGFDVSELSDFVLGWACIDFKHDDLNSAMFDDMMGRKQVTGLPIAEAAPAPAPNNAELDRLRAENERLAQELAKCQGRLNELDGGVEIVMPELVLFDTGKAKLKSSGKALLDQIATKIRSQYPDTEITVVGHTDSRPIRYSGWKSNWELGAARSLAVVHYMIDVAGLPKSRFMAATPADNQPIASNDTKEGRQENRRSVIVLKAQKKAVTMQ